LSVVLGACLSNVEDYYLLLVITILSNRSTNLSKIPGCFEPFLIRMYNINDINNNKFYGTGSED